MSCHRLYAHAVSGVVRQDASGICCCCGGGVSITGIIGNCMCMLLDKMSGVAGMVPVGSEVLLVCSWY